MNQVIQWSIPLLLIAMMLTNGCTQLNGRWPRRQRVAERHSEAAVPLPERVRVAVTLTGGHNNTYAESLQQRLSSALECSGRCLVVNDSHPGQVGFVSTIAPPLANLRGPADYIVTIEIHEFTPYRPMRLRANFRLTDANTGMELLTICNTWESVGDLAPAGANRETGRMLRLPVVPVVEERDALTRTSPQAFLDNVSREVAGTLSSAIPDFPEWSSPLIEESVSVPEASHSPQ